MSRRTSRRVAPEPAAAADPPAPKTRPAPDMSEEQVSALWAQFAADHFEVVEQLPLELHRNSRLLRELDAESISQQTRLQARVREYVAYRVAVARRPEQRREGANVKVTEGGEGKKGGETGGEKEGETGGEKWTEERAPEMEKEDTPDVKPRVSGSAEAAHRAAPEEAEEHAAEAAVEAALGSTPREASAPASAPAPAPSRVNLADISSLISELVRNREEKVAIAVGAYNAIDRHIRALDSALSAHETSVLGFETPKPAGRSVSVMSEGVPPGIEADPNEPRYCYCNQVSYGEMVGCDNDDCPMEWFHLACLGMSQPPAGQWLCDVCRKDRKEGGGGGGGAHKKRRKR